MLPTDKQLSRCKELRDLPVVRVQWQDACVHVGWHDFDEYRDKRTLRCQSVGYLTRNDKACVQLVQSISENGAAGESITIPRSWVLKVQTIQRPGNKRHKNGHA